MRQHEGREYVTLSGQYSTTAILNSMRQHEGREYVTAKVFANYNTKRVGVTGFLFSQPILWRFWL